MVPQMLATAMSSYSGYLLRDKQKRLYLPVTPHTLSGVTFVMDAIVFSE